MPPPLAIAFRLATTSLLNLISELLLAVCIGHRISMDTRLLCYREERATKVATIDEGDALLARIETFDAMRYCYRVLMPQFFVKPMSNKLHKAFYCMQLPS